MAKTILIVEDEKDLVLLMEYNLTRSGFLVTKASGLELCQGQVFVDGRFDRSCRIQHDNIGSLELVKRVHPKDDLFE